MSLKFLGARYLGEVWDVKDELVKEHYVEGVK
jgi:hypothetical protein